VKGLFFLLRREVLLLSLLTKLEERENELLY